MKEVNLLEKLKNAPKGFKLYSCLNGEVELYSIAESKISPIMVRISLKDGKESYAEFRKNGTYGLESEGECLLFPNRHMRDWDKFKIPKVGDQIMNMYDTLYTVTELKPRGFKCFDEQKRNYIVSYFDTFYIMGESKFKSGDIVMLNNFPLYIRNVRSKDYIVDELLGNSICVKFNKDDLGKASLITNDELKNDCNLMRDEKGDIVRWIPKKGEGYYFITNNNGISVTSNNDSPFDRFKIDYFNCFPTKEMAIDFIKEMKKAFKNHKPYKPYKPE